MPNTPSPLIKIIDPHLHFFNLKCGDYHWLQPQNPPFWPDKAAIHRSYTEHDLSLPSSIQLSGFVHIEAGFDNQRPWREIDWLENTVTLPFKSVATINLTNDPTTFQSDINKLSKYSSLIGVRHILDEQAQAILSSPDVYENFACLAHHSLLFETQVNGSDTQGIKQLVHLAQAQPTLHFVINHGAFPPQCDDEIEVWKANMKYISCCPNITIKASGWEMINRSYSANWINFIVCELLSLFGQQRVMLASNFPLCTFSQGYAALWKLYLNLSIPESIKKRLIYDNALQIYHLSHTD
ncbi:amidohydrolase family protein [Vibrio sp. Of7-15]|uniref:amidohydrolase family protein n=1 Tax=Vibrio sp. Of7-15 TaxID=2724879 RepID=UPI001EF395FE|nr:amidohydrolase family protein [Vibrio sp. Of7-15]MCG7495406.1 amidohydrolase family protein [Vibrio sp. Of7-15]